MKKLLIGCLVFVVILIALLTFGVNRLFHVGAQLRDEIASAEKEFVAIDRQFPFKAPPDGKLTEPRLKVWLDARAKINTHDQQGMDALKQIGPLRRLRRLASLMPESLTNFANVLREEKMSRAEYAWITDQLVGALKSRPAAKDPKLADLAAIMEADTSSESQPPAKTRMRFQTNNGNPVAYAPLAPEDAAPILALIKKHEPELRKVAPPAFPDAYLHGVLGQNRQSARTVGEPATSSTSANAVTSSTR